jgi:hypothetical protein
MFLGLAVSNWMIWVTMILFILIYFVVTERMNSREEAADEERRDLITSDAVGETLPARSLYWT